MKIKRLTTNRGFTIVELMIALSVLSVILIMATTILIQIGGLYNKGVNAANLQNTTRTVAADVSSVLQFSGNAPYACTQHTPLSCDADLPAALSLPNPQSFTTLDVTVSVHSYCIDTTRYSYVLGGELGYDQSNGTTTPHVLWRDKIKPNADCLPLNLSKQDVAPDSSSADSGTKSSGYEMLATHMRLTRFKAVPISANIYTVDVWTAFGDSDLVHADAATGHANCDGGKGTQFCATSNLTTTVTGRVF